jgi:hypothetical protein
MATRLWWSTLALLAAFDVACDPADQGPPPVTPDTPRLAAPAPNPAAATAGDGSGAGDPEAMYASGEYALGQDSDAYDDSDPAALTDFHAALDAHGAWTEDPTYGTVWFPAPSEVGRDFTPYASAGHWVYDTDYAWVSDYDWGWAPFHYGRWVLLDGRGWAWVPGREYAGAWVGWGVDDGYGFVGWYPLVPAYLWFGGVGVAYAFPIGSRWSYCPHGQIFAPELGTHLIRGAAAVTLAGRVHALPAVVGGAARGPDPARLGFDAAHLPHASGAAAAGLARAQRFARPSTAVALGARPVTRAATTAWASGPRPSLTVRPSLTRRGGATPTPAGRRPAASGAAPQSPPTHSRPATESEPAFRGSPEMHMGGGHRR